MPPRPEFHGSTVGQGQGRADGGVDGVAAGIQDGDPGQGGV